MRSSQRNLSVRRLKTDMGVMDIENDETLTPNETKKRLGIKSMDIKAYYQL